MDTKEPEKKPMTTDSSEDKSRRTFLKYAAVLSALLATGGVASIAKAVTNPAAETSTTTSTGFPRIKIANVSDLQLNNAITFNYPLDNEPNILVKLGEKADGGVGADGDIVAFSQICQHLGCIYAFEAAGSSPDCNHSFQASGPVGYCCCHGSVYDFLHGAKVIGGPSPRPAPQVTLEVDSTGNIFAMGMSPPTIFGHQTGSTDVNNDLQGGTPVS